MKKVIGWMLAGAVVLSGAWGAWGQAGDPAPDREAIVREMMIRRAAAEAAARAAAARGGENVPVGVAGGMPVGIGGAVLPVPGARAGELGVEVYRMDAGKGVGGEWSKKEVTKSPNGKLTFLGRFGREGVALSLEDLPEHGRVRLSFDLVILMTWDGDASMSVGDDGPDVLNVTVDKGPRILHSTFELRSRWTRFTQSYPGRFPYDHFQSGMGAAATGTLGFVLKDHEAGVADDSVYHIERSFGHKGKSLKVVFSGLNLEGLENESWGLANVKVEVLPEAKAFDEEVFERWWGDLGSVGPDVFVPAMEGLVNMGEGAAAALRKKVAPMAVGKEQEELIGKLIAKLDDDSYREREKASAGLREMGRAAEGALRTAREKTTSEEVKGRIDELLGRLKGAPAEAARRRVRVVEVLERIGGEEAKAGLAEVAKGGETVEGWEAKGAVVRLEGKGEVPVKVELPPGLPKERLAPQVEQAVPPVWNGGGDIIDFSGPVRWGEVWD